MPVEGPVSRPRSVTLLAMGVLSIAALGLLRAVLTVRQWQFLSGWTGVSPAYLAFTGLGVGLLGLAVFWALWWQKCWAPRLTRAVLLTYALAYWLDQIFMADHPFDDPAGMAKAFLPANWPFAAGVTFITMAITAWVLSRANVKAYFGDEHE